jgi:Protein of unknown function DUF262/HNH endonuclease
MAISSNLVNLDAMLKRADFAIAGDDSSFFESVNTISLRDFTEGGMIGPALRKPDFQRETNHWSPSQVASLLDCFVNGDLIPSVILWKSPQHLFVIDGGHRLSVLKAWILDDYGDGPLSRTFFGDELSLQQRKAAQQTRTIINEQIGSWQHFQAKTKDGDLSPDDLRKRNAVISRGLPIQWVNGDADKAESSFFKINTQGTPLDTIEELLLKNRRKPIPIAARAIIRSGNGNRYWSSFDAEKAKKVEESAKTIHQLLFDPEIKSPIKTLDLPLGGAKGIRAALQILIDLLLIANRDSSGSPKSLSDMLDDLAGDSTVETLKQGEKIISRITGNNKGSLGLHPAVYYYGPTGRHSGPMLMGTVELIARKVKNNDKEFFRKFTRVRGELEGILVEHKDLVATIMQKHVSAKRTRAYVNLLENLISILDDKGKVDESRLVQISGLEGKIVHGSSTSEGKKFSDDTKSQTFIKTALKNTLRCPICQGYLDPSKSSSYDHITPVRSSGRSEPDNCQIVHPYCNQSVKQ